MALTLNIDPLLFAANPAMLTLNTGTAGDTAYVVSAITVVDTVETLTELYRGVVNTSGVDVSVDISFLFYAYKSEVSINLFRITFGTGEDELTADTKVYGGGISKLALRRYRSANNYINNKLQATQANFILTNRSASPFIFVPENEIQDLHYYSGHATPKVFKVCANGQTIDTVDFSAQTEESIALLFINTLRELYFTQTGKLTSVLDVLTPSNQFCFSIIITEANPTAHYLKFKNSYGCNEKVALYRTTQFTPVVAPTDKITIYDSVINDFVEKNERNNYTNTYDFELHVPENTNMAFVLDMLVSDMQQLVTSDQSGTHTHNVRVTTTASLAFNNTAQTIPLKVSLLDTETYATALNETPAYSQIQLQGDNLLAVTNDAQNTVLTQ